MNAPKIHLGVLMSLPDLPPEPNQTTPPYGQPPITHHAGRPPQAPYPPPPQQVHYSVQQPGTDSSKRFLNLSGGMLIATITLILLVCCIGPIAFCLFSPVLAGLSDIGDAAQPPPTVTITSCKITDGEYLNSAEVGIRVTNNGTKSEGYTVKIVVKDASGSRVGDGSTYVSSVAAGETVSDESTIFLDAKGGTTCSVSDVS